MSKAVASLDFESVNEKLRRSQLEEEFLAEFKDIFPEDIPAVSDEAKENGEFVDSTFPKEMPEENSRVRHRIKLTDPSVVINEQQYPYPQKYLNAWRKLIDQHYLAGRIRCSNSPYASPSLIIPKKDQNELPRWVCDYRALNRVTVRDRSPLPNVEETIRMVATGKVFSHLDQMNAFFQTQMNEEDIPLTAVKTPWGLWEWTVMPMGLTNAPATHQARLEEALGDLISTICAIYLDDIVVFFDNKEDHAKHLHLVLERLRSNHLYFGLKKSRLFRRHVKFLGHQILGDGIRPDDEKVAGILNWKSPSLGKGARRFLGTVQWMKKFIHGLEKFVGRLTPLTSSKLDKRDFYWGPAEENAFINIKKLMKTLPVLRNVDFDSEDPLWLFTDASGTGLGAALFQGKEWQGANPVAYESRKMTPAERNYPVHKQELLAVMHALNKWRLLLLGMKVNILTDHHSLTHLLKQRSLSMWQAPCLEQLSDFDIEFRYIKGPENTLADGLSQQEETAALSTMQLSKRLKDEVCRGYEGDKFCDSVKISMPLREGCREEDGLLYLENRLVIPNKEKLRDDLIQAAHTESGHLGWVKTLGHLRRSCFWQGMSGDVERLVRCCDICQRTKDRTTLTDGSMRAPHVPKQPLNDISLDFIGPLPLVNG